MREIVFDTETTGFDFSRGDRMVEIGCVELFNRCETGETFHAYYHPERDMPAGAEQIHGLSATFLSKFPVFSAVAHELMAFIGDAPLIAHNATFDFGFLNGELARCGHDPVCLTRMIDTLAISQKRHPGAKHSLDALCTRYGIDRSHRVLHGALLDAQLLSQVYVELTGGRQIGLGLVADIAPAALSIRAAPPSRARPPRLFTPSEGELAAHAAFMKGVSDPLWTVEPSA